MEKEKAYIITVNISKINGGLKIMNHPKKKPMELGVIKENV